MAVIQLVAPLAVCIIFGVLARRRKLISPEENRGLQQFVLKFCIPCTLFNSCLEAQLGPEAIMSMAVLIPVLLCSSFLGFRLRKKYGIHNMPMLFSAHETGMLGIPLFIILFGTEQAYRMGLLDMAQAFIGVPVISLLSASSSDSTSFKSMAAKVFSSPMLIMSLLGFTLGLSGAMDKLESIGVGQVIYAVTSFLAQPVSAVMLFSIGYNFTLSKESSGIIFKTAFIYLAVTAAACLVMQGALSLLPSADILTRWAVLLYCALPASYLTPGLGKNEEEYRFASGVCSVLTLVTLAVFCVMTMFR